MSLFRPYIYKQKPDLQNNGPVKNGFFHFLELYIRKFWKLLTVNLWCFFLTLPMVVFIFYLLNGVFADKLAALGGGTILMAGVGFLASLFSFVPEWLFRPLLILSVLLYGPMMTGVTYVFRNFAREEHAWLSDLWARAWANLRQGLLFGLLDLLLVWLFFNGMLGGREVGYALNVILSVVCGLALVIWLFMRHYIYLMAVTVELSAVRILKNAWLFVVLGFGRNVLSAVVAAGCVLVTFLLAPLLTVILLPFLFFSVSWFATVFICYPIVKKYLIVPAMEQMAARQEAVEDGPPDDSDPTE